MDVENRSGRRGSWWEDGCAGGIGGGLRVRRTEVPSDGCRGVRLARSKGGFDLTPTTPLRYQPHVI